MQHNWPNYSITPITTINARMRRKYYCVQLKGMF
jgi:hypothetical protein